MSNIDTVGVYLSGIAVAAGVAILAALTPAQLRVDARVGSIVYFLLASVLLYFAASTAAFVRGETKIHGRDASTFMRISRLLLGLGLLMLLLACLSLLLDLKS